MPLHPTDRAHFAAMLTTVNAILGAGRELSPDVIEIYWRALAEFDLAAVRQALDRHVKNPDSGQFMPKPADLIRMLGGTTQDAALIAWAKVEKAIRRVGSWSEVVFDDPLIHRCIDDMGGWQLLCGVAEDEMPFRAREFENRYRGFAMRRETPPFPPTLIGRVNAENMRKGYEREPPMFIGDHRRCALVMKKGAESGPILQIGEALPEIKRIEAAA